MQIKFVPRDEQISKTVLKTNEARIWTQQFSFYLEGESLWSSPALHVGAKAPTYLRTKNKNKSKRGPIPSASSNASRPAGRFLADRFIADPSVADRFLAALRQ